MPVRLSVLRNAAGYSRSASRRQFSRSSISIPRARIPAVRVSVECLPSWQNRKRFRFFVCKSLILRSKTVTPFGFACAAAGCQRSLTANSHGQPDRHDPVKTCGRQQLEPTRSRLVRREPLQHSRAKLIRSGRRRARVLRVRNKPQTVPRIGRGECLRVRCRRLPIGETMDQ